jgi:hypothetical protein
MRAILILGVMLMPWSDDMAAVSSAIAQQRAPLKGGIPSYVEPPGGPGGQQRYATDPLEMLGRELSAAVQRGEMTPEAALARYRAALTQEERDKPPLSGRDMWRMLDEEARPTEVPRLPRWGSAPR